MKKAQNFDFGPFLGLIESLVNDLFPLFLNIHCDITEPKF